MSGEAATGAGFVARLLDVIEQDIVPLSRAGVDRGNKIFGAAVLRKSDLSLVVAETNNEIENPLWHGEMHALKRFYELPAGERPLTKNCLLLSTHEPCSLCLSAITWSGFGVFYYLFGYEVTRDAFDIPHDLRILDEVFGVKDGGYARNNAFWTSHGIPDLIDRLPKPDRGALITRTRRIAGSYEDLSAAYQRSKAGSSIPLA